MTAPRSLGSALVVALFSMACSGQTPEENARSLVEKALWKGEMDGHVIKDLRVLGDSGAAVIAKVISIERLDSLQIEGVLELLQASFSDPNSVPVVSDRQPRAALLLLRYLEFATQDSNMRKKIEDARRSLPKISLRTDPH